MCGVAETTSAGREARGNAAAQGQHTYPAADTGPEVPTLSYNTIVGDATLGTSSRITIAAVLTIFFYKLCGSKDVYTANAYSHCVILIVILLLYL